MMIDRDAPLTTEEIVERVAWKLCFLENEVWEEAPASYHVRWRREAAQMLVSGADRIVEALSAREATEGGEAVAWQPTERDMAQAWLAKLVAKLSSKPDHADDILWLERLNALLFSAHPSPSKPEGEPTAQVEVDAASLIAIRDALAAGDLNEAWHQLYKVADPGFCNMEPWRNLEHKAALRPASIPPSGVAVKPWELVHEYAQNYEWRGDEGDYTPAEAERAMIEDAIHGFLGELEDAGALTTVPSGVAEARAEALEEAGGVQSHVHELAAGIRDREPSRSRSHQDAQVILNLTRPLANAAPNNAGPDPILSKEAE